MQNFRNLKVWAMSHSLVLEIYKATEQFLVVEKYGVTSQLRRAAVSIPTNIAEGCGRDGDAELKRFLQISMGSACETEYLLLLSKDLGFIATETHNKLQLDITKIMKMPTAFIKKLKHERKKANS